MNTESFALRHIGIRENDLEKMLSTIGVNSIEELIEETIPKDIRLTEGLSLPQALSESEFLQLIQNLSEKNRKFKSYIGLGYHESVIPSVIKRNILESPGWYTAYTPYQAEIAQGRLEALLNFQTVVCELTGMEIANASLLDESTAAAEAMTMLFDIRSRDQKKNGVVKFFVSQEILPQTLSLLETRSKPLGIELVVGDHESFSFGNDFYGAILQYPGKYGQVHNYQDFISNAQDNHIKVAVAADILSLVMLTPPGEWGADVVVGTTQRFGIPLGYGGPHAAFFATKEAYKRNIPGRIIGMTKDTDGNPALRMALQTREQHIKRDKATSNICTAQVLLAVMAGMYAVYHGPEGLKHIANRIHEHTKTVSQSIEAYGFEQLNTVFFDTLRFKVDNVHAIRTISESKGINLNYIDDETVSISLHEAFTRKDIRPLVNCFVESQALDQDGGITEYEAQIITESLKRQSNFLQHETFNSYHSETELMRYIKKVGTKRPRLEPQYDFSG